MRMAFPTRRTGVITSRKGERLTAPINVVVYNSTGQYVLTGSNDRTIDLWNPGTLSHIRSFTGHGYEVLDLSVNADSSLFASCGGDRAVYVWDVVAGRIVRRFHGHMQRVNAVAFNRDASVLASGSYDARVRLWDCKSQSNAPIQVLDDARDSVTSIIISDHEIITGSVDGRVRTYDLRKGQLRTDVVASPVTSIALTQDADCLLVSTLDSTVRLFDRANGGMLQAFVGGKNTQYRVRSCFSSNDAYAVSGSEDGCVRAWDVFDGHVAYELPDHNGAVITDVAMHPSRPAMATVGVDASLSIYTV